MVSIYIEGLANQSIPNGYIIAYGVIIALVTLAFYLLRSIGLFCLARRHSVKHAFLAWIPFVWVFTACKLIGNVKIFGKPFEKLAIWFCLIFVVSEVLMVVYEFFVYFPLVGNFLFNPDAQIVLSDSAASIAGLEKYVFSSGIYVNAQSGFVYPYEAIGGNYAVVRMLNVIAIISPIFDLAATVVIILVYVNLFKRYWPQHHMLAAILSIFGLFAPFAFAIRKKDPINYLDYLRSRYNYNPYGYGNPYGGYGNPYGSPFGNPYGGNNGQPQGPKAPDHPFEEFAEKGEIDPGEPFEEFNDSDKKEENK